MQGRLSKLLRSRILRTLILAFLVLSLAGAAYGFKMTYDPGPVSAQSPRGEPRQGFATHAAFEKDCKHCHAPVKCLSANLCQDCHFEIAQERAEASGLHGLLPGTDKCHTCHKEHEGREFVLSAVAYSNFANINHERLTSFSLVQHKTGYDGNRLECRSCHRDGRYTPEGVDCTGCHRDQDQGYMDEHVSRFGSDCLVCHDGQDRMADFEHEQVYALEGGHEDVGCEECHRGQVHAGQVRDCAACHEAWQVHEGEFGEDCARCHGVAAWTPAKLTRHVFRLDHGQVGQGEGEVECETCHTESYVEHDCYGCHEHQPDDVRALHLEEGIASYHVCIDCHPTGQPDEAAAGGESG